MTPGFEGRFEGSYLGADEKISAAAVMECKICWTPYDPAMGDETRQIEPGTPFAALPHDWKCPTCDAAREQFMVFHDPGRVGLAVEPAPAEDPMATPAAMRRGAVARLEAAFREIHNAKMRDVPFSNKALHVEAVGFRPWEGRFLGVLVAPWFMNLTILPGAGEDWSDLVTGAKEVVAFPSGEYEFIHTVRPDLGGYKGCSLFSPMAEFANQLQATDVARAVMGALFDPAHREGVRQPEPAPAPSRRALLSGRPTPGAATGPATGTSTEPSAGTPG